MSKELLEAVTYGDVKDVRIALRSTKFDINQRDGLQETTPIIIALYRKKIGMAKLILEHNPDINAKDIFRRTALHYAVKNNDIDHVEVILAANPDVNIIDFLDDTPMDLAKENGNREIIDALKKHGALTEKEKRGMVSQDFDLLKLSPQEIANVENKPQIEKLIASGSFISVFASLDYKRQEAILMSNIGIITKSPDVFEQIKSAMKETHARENAGCNTVTTIKLVDFATLQRE